MRLDEDENRKRKTLHRLRIVVPSHEGSSQFVKRTESATEGVESLGKIVMVVQRTWRISVVVSHAAKRTTSNINVILTGPRLPTSQ